MKLVSLLPSATEIVCQLGLEKNLVGVSHECDYPASVIGLPRLTTSRVNHKDNSYRIHETVEDLLKNAASVYDLDLDLLKSLQPDVLITQDLCDVCAVSLEEVKDACQQVLGGKAQILSLRPNQLSDIWDDVERVGKALDAGQSYQAYREDVDRRIEFIRHTVQRSAAPKKKTLTIEWIDPVMIGGMWVPEMIEVAGGEALFVKSGKPAMTVDFETLSQVDPETVLVKPCGFKMDQSLNELETLKAAVPLNCWTATAENQVYLIDGNAYFNRPGPRIIDSLELLAYCMHPELFPEFAEKYSGGFQNLSSLV